MKENKMNKEFERNQKMQLDLERLQKMQTAGARGNDRDLAQLIKEDTNLVSYYWFLRFAVTFEGGNPALVKKLLDHPAVDQTSQRYKRIVSDAYSNLGASHKDADPEILKLLLDKFKDEPQLIDQSLSFIFSSVVKNRPEGGASVDAAKMLVENGADILQALSHGEEGFKEQERAFDIKLAALRDFKERVMKP